MKKIIITTIIALLFSSHSFSNYEHTWIQTEAGLLGGTHFQINTVENNTGWAITYSNYQENIALTSHINRETGKPAETNLDALSISKTLAAPLSWGLINIGLGLGVSQGTWLENCSDNQQHFIGSSKLCDQRNGSQLGIPLHASAIFGRYIGIGMSLQAFVQEDRTFLDLTFLFPLGAFAK